MNDILQLPASQAAPLLLGWELERKFGPKKVRVKIVETEAYEDTDAASHSYSGMTPRTEVMFGEPGKLYVYFTYGMHYCCNIVTGPRGKGSAVLIRAVEPLEGEELLSENRAGKTPIELTNGPAKLCQALMIDKTFNNHDLTKTPLILQSNPVISSNLITTTTRIGISKAKDVPWRFYITGNPYVSKP